MISGGREITGWKRNQRGRWTVEIPEVREGKWLFHQLFVNDRRAQRARTPDEGFFRVDGPKSKDVPFNFKYKGTEIKSSWAERGDVEVVLLCGWQDLRMPIRKVDESTRTVTLAGPANRSTAEADARYYIENAPEALTAAGEWYLDRRTGILTYLPITGENIETATFVAPVVTQLIRFEGEPFAGRFVHHIVFRGLTFQDADWDNGPDGYADVQAGIEIESTIKAVGAVDCAIERCTMTGLGGWAVDLGVACRRNRIVGNEMRDIGAGGVKLGEAKLGDETGTAIIRSEEALQNTDNVISDNSIHDIGVVFPSAVGVWAGHNCVRDIISHNHIYDTNYSGISMGWTWGYGPHNTHHNIIEYNHVHDISRGMLNDLGGIYMLGVQPGTVIRNNLVHDVNCFKWGARGIYLDNGPSGLLIENNIVYRTQTLTFYVGDGRDNTVRNNVFALGRDGQFSIRQPEDHLSFTFERNIVYWNSGLLLTGKLYPSLEPCRPPCTPGGEYGLHVEKNCKHFHFDRNVYYDVRTATPLFYGLPFAEWQKRGANDFHSIIADPRFVDADRFDFRLKLDSPALKLGFKPIDMSTVGPRRESGPGAVRAPAK